MGISRSVTGLKSQRLDVLNACEWLARTACVTAEWRGWENVTRWGDVAFDWTTNVLLTSTNVIIILWIANGNWYLLLTLSKSLGLIVFDQSRSGMF